MTDLSRMKNKHINVFCKNTWTKILPKTYVTIIYLIDHMLLLYSGMSRPGYNQPAQTQLKHTHKLYTEFHITCFLLNCTVRSLVICVRIKAVRDFNFR